MKGILVFDADYGPGDFLGHSQMWCVDLPNGRYHIESRIRRGVLLPNSPRDVKVTPCDKSCFKSNVPDEVAEIAMSQIYSVVTDKT